MGHRRAVEVGRIYKSNNFGEFKVINFERVNKSGVLMYRIKFLDTEGERIVSSRTIVTGGVRDYRKPTYFGVGYLGDEYPNITHIERVKKVWVGMISRCYNIRDDSYDYYGGKGVTVIHEWHDYSKFFSDLPNVDGWDKEKFMVGEIQLDKDYKQVGVENKIYSLETCTFLTHKENSNLATYDIQRVFSALSPEGIYFPTVRNVANFCKENSIPDKNAVYRVIDERAEGTPRTIHGWVFGYSGEDKNSLMKDKEHKSFTARKNGKKIGVYGSVREFMEANEEKLGSVTYSSLSSSVSRCLNKERKTYKDWTFKRLVEEPESIWQSYVLGKYPSWLLQVTK